MSMSLAEALSHVELETGKTYHCNIKGQMVLVKVFDPLLPSPPSIDIDESDVMMEAWTDFPLPEPNFLVTVTMTPGPFPLPDPPDIPPDEDETP